MRFPCLCLVGFWDWDYVSQLPCVNASPRGPMCFRCLIFSLSGPCELLFLLCFIASLDLNSGECNVVSLYVLCCPVNGSVCFVCCVSLGVILGMRSSGSCVSSS